MDIIDRIFSALVQSGLSQIEFAEKLGVKKNAISQWKSRLSKSYTKYLPQIADVLGTTVQWLVTGEDVQKDQAAAPQGDDLTNEELQMIFAYRGADARARSMVDLALEPFKRPSQSDEAM